MPTNYAQEYKAGLNQPFKEGLKTIDLFNSCEKYEFLNAKTINIPTLSMTGFRNHGRGNAIQTADDYDNSWEPKKLEHDRSKFLLADPKDIDETNMARSIANITKVFNTEHKIPEIDSYVLSKLYKEATGAGVTPDTTALTKANFLDKFDELMLAMDEAEVPSEGRIAYVTPKTYTLMKQCEGLSRVLQVGKGETEIKRNVYGLDDVKFVKVPASRMKSKYVFSNEAGYTVAEDAVQIEMMIVHPKATVNVISLDQALLDEPKATTSGKYAWFERTYMDSFVLANRKDGIAVVTSA